jgi:membrane protein DedA with SNARE-associated domain
MGAVLAIIQGLGYGGVFLLMLAESTFLPVPSELVLPFAGYLVAQGAFGLVEVIAVGLLGSIAGSVISYCVGKFVGRKAIVCAGKYFLLSEHDLDIAHRWFRKHGEKTIFICRFIPAVRHVISIPAGLAKMDFKKFVIYTAAGALVWNTFLVIIGIQLQKNWEIILGYTQWLDIIAIAGIICFVVWFYSRHIKQSERRQKKRRANGR